MAIKVQISLAGTEWCGRAGGVTIGRSRAGASPARPTHIASAATAFPQAQRMLVMRHVPEGPRRPRWTAGACTVPALALALALFGFGCGKGGEEVAAGASGATTPGGAGTKPAPTTPAGITDNRSGMGGGSPPARAVEIPQEPSPFRFEDATRDAGIDFVHASGMTAEKYYPSANGSGAAIFDFDGDGDMDVYLASGTTLPVGSSDVGRNRLFENLGGGKFRDATEASGLGHHGYCHAAIVGDVDNDGDPDVFLWPATAATPSSSTTAGASSPT